MHFFTHSRTGVALIFGTAAAQNGSPAIEGKITVTHSRAGKLQYSVGIPALPKAQADELTALASDIMEKLPAEGSINDVQVAYRVITSELKREATAA